MKNRDYRALAGYVRTCADLMELRDWTTCVTVGGIVSPDRPDGNAWQATSRSAPGRKFVHIVFADDVRDWRIDRLRETTAHELAHAHFAPLMEIFHVDLHPHLKAQAHDLLNANATRSLEFGVEAMGLAVAPRLPLIDWPPPKRSGRGRRKSRGGR